MQCCMICLFGIIKTDKLIEPLCGSPVMILLTALFLTKLYPIYIKLLS